MQIDYYLINFTNLDSKRILNEWYWLVGDKSIIFLTKAGDILLKDADNKLWFLDVGNGELKLISNDCSDFLNGNLEDKLIQELLLPKLIDDLETEYSLKFNEVFSYTLLPIFGGKYDSKNMYPLDIYEHYELCGQIHFKIKDFPDGTVVQMKVVD
jgi:hypothetical protein